MRPNILVLGISTIVGSVVFSSFFNEAHAVGGSATVVVLRGKAKTGDGKAIAEKQKIDPGTSVITEAGSFVRLLFPDNTQLNVGPNTTMKIEAGKPGEASIVDLVGGSIRAKVTKDLLKKDDGPVKEKMVIKTKTAAMGIRGTELNASFNPLNNITALITFEGIVAMARLDPGGAPPPPAALFSALQGGGVQSVGAGQFSGCNPEQPGASIPVKISPAQLESMRGNDTFAQNTGTEKPPASASPMPPGVDPKGFASGSDKALGDAVSKIAGADTVQSMVKEATKDDNAKNGAPPEGFINKATGEYAPRAGGFIDLASGRYVPPPPGSAFDPNTGVFVPPKAMGAFDPATGAYVPPKGVELDPVKGFVAEAQTKPSADGSAAPPPPPEVLALVNAMNTAADPDNAGVTVTTDTTFAPNSGGEFKVDSSSSSETTGATGATANNGDVEVIVDEPADTCTPSPCGIGEGGGTIQNDTDVKFTIQVN